MGILIQAALTCAKSFAFVILCVRARCWPKRVIMAPQDLYVHWNRTTGLELPESLSLACTSFIFSLWVVKDQGVVCPGGAEGG